MCFYYLRLTSFKSRDFGANSASSGVNANFCSTKFYENLAVRCRNVGMPTNGQTRQF